MAKKVKKTLHQQYRWNISRKTMPYTYQLLLAGQFNIKKPEKNDG